MTKTFEHAKNKKWVIFTSNYMQNLLIIVGKLVLLQNFLQVGEFKSNLTQMLARILLSYVKKTI